LQAQIPSLVEISRTLSDFITILELGDIRITALKTGLVKVKRSHFESFLGKRLSLLDRRWTEWLPVFCYLVEHPEKTILVDTGVHPEMQSRTFYQDGTMNGWLSSRIVRFQLNGFPTLPELLKGLDLSVDAIDELVITHLHLDHVGRLDLFSNKPTWINRAEKSHPFGVMDKTIPEQMNWKFSDWDDQIKGFDSMPFSDDGRLHLISTPGHSDGHQSLLILGNEVHVLIAGDCSYTESQLINEEVPGISLKRELATETLRNIKHYAVQNPLIYLSSHDPEVEVRIRQLRKVYQS
jgi:glyoxylase-like metal-dependent hydrolase (beta-lactamase superfamily II)